MTVNWIDPRKKLPDDQTEVWLALRRADDSALVIGAGYEIDEDTDDPDFRFRTFDDYGGYNYYSLSEILAWAVYEEPEFTKDMLK